MECANSVCRRPIEQARPCPVCKKLTYCSQQCRLDHWYSGHQLSCGVEETQHSSKFRLQDFREEDQKARVLGKGSYGEVRLVTHVPTGENYALKVVPGMQINKAQFQKHNSLQVMRREILLHRALDHPNIIKLYDHIEDGENVYLVLELALRGSLFYEIHRRSRLSESQARIFFRETCEGVSYLHSRQIMHRDLKPENILLDQNSTVKICDFGWCAKGTEARKTFCGTLDYMAPEMVMGGGHTFSVDLWALGVLLYELVHGRAPFGAKKESEKCEQILNARAQMDSGLSLEVRDLISGLLKVNPLDRLSLSQVLSHPWLNDRFPKRNSLLGARIKKFLPGVGIAEGVVSSVESDCCTVEFASAGVREQLPATEVSGMIRRKKGLLRDGEKSREMSPIPSGTQSPIEEAALLEQIEEWCKAPSQIPMKPLQIPPKFASEAVITLQKEEETTVEEGKIQPEEMKRPPSLPNFEGEQQSGDKAEGSSDVSSEFSGLPVAESRGIDDNSPKPAEKPLFLLSDDPLPRATADFSPVGTGTVDFERERQLIEEKNELFYSTSEAQWAIRPSNEMVILAPHFSTRLPSSESPDVHPLIEEVEKLAAMTKRSPDNPIIRLQALENANEALQRRKLQLEALLKDIDAGYGRVRKPIDLRFRDEGKGGFLRWIGSVIGCADRLR